MHWKIQQMRIQHYLLKRLPNIISTYITCLQARYNKIPQDIFLIFFVVFVIVIALYDDQRIMSNYEEKNHNTKEQI